MCDSVDRPSPGTFIISLDCEGKWGLADHLDARTHALLTTGNLLSINKRLIYMLDELNLKATFAFVGAYTLSTERFSDERNHFEPIFETPWGQSVQSAMRSHGLDGWFNPEAAPTAIASGHEIAGHGFSHLSFACCPSRDLIRWELGQMVSLSYFAMCPWTWVFPRNQVAHEDVLASYDVVAYRAAKPLLTTRLGRATSLLAELVPGSSEPTATPRSAPQAIPAGHFFNWRSGARRLVPPSRTVARWKSMIDHAVRTGGTVHLWAHPHNFLTGPGGLEVLYQVLAYAAEKVAEGSLINQTQLAYSEAWASSGGTFR